MPSQWIGKLNCEDLGVVDFVTGCAHKFGGPKGCGFLKIPESSDHVSILQGGAQEGAIEPGIRRLSIYYLNACCSECC